MGGTPCRTAGQAGRSGQTRLEPRQCGQLFRSRAKGGAKTGPNPTDRGKSGTKRHVVVDTNGTPLAAVLSAANVHDSRMFVEVVDAIPFVYSGRRGRSRFRPEKLHADKGYDFAFCRRALRERNILPRIARRGVESSERLGRFRWVVERTGAWLNQFRRLRIRWERRDDVHEAFLLIGWLSFLLRWRHYSLIT